MEVSAPDYKDLGMWGVKRLMDGVKNKEGMEELIDNEIGPDVRYVLSQNDIALVKRYMRSPITTAEYRELRFKLLELQGQQVAGQKLGEITVLEEKKEIKRDFDLTPDLNTGEHQKQQVPENQTLINLVA